MGELPRRVLMTTDTVGGVWTYALELARALGREGVGVALAAMGGRPSAAQREEARGAGLLELFESDLRLEWMPDPWRDVASAGTWLLALETEVRPDVVHVNGYAHAALPFRVPALVVAHSCVASWWRACRGEDAPAGWDRYRSEVAAGLAAAAAVVAPSHAMLAAVREHWGVAGGSVVPNAREAGEWRPLAKEPFVLAVGRLWDEAKNIGALAHVAPSLPWPVYVAGEPRHPGGGGDARLEGVNLLGRLSSAELAPWYGRAAIYALPARYEPFGLSALEAALAGCALVLGDIPSLREIWGDAAVFVAPDDREALRDAIAGLARDDARRARLAAAARERARTYTPRRMARGYLELYRRLLHQRPSAPLAAGEFR